jgi:SAM-dependent methyltransferase
MRTGRNDPCFCGSGRTYKFCHLPIDEARIEDKYAAAQKVYAKHWSRTSEFHFDARLYHWMAERLSPFAPPSKIFDVGCGSGHGLVALYETLGPATQVVSVEENASCVTIAERTVAKIGIPTKAILRLEVFHSGNGYFFEARPVPTPFPPGCTLIEGDVCNAPRLIEALSASERFDAA